MPLRAVNLRPAKQASFKQCVCLFADTLTRVLPCYVCLCRSDFAHWHSCLCLRFIAGVAGLTLGGGAGFLSGMHGLCLDNLLAVDIALADGTCVTADEHTNPDLFWAVRGEAIYMHIYPGALQHAWLGTYGSSMCA